MEPSTLPYMPFRQRAGTACVFRTGKFSLMRYSMTRFPINVMETGADVVVHMARRGR